MPPAGALRLRDGRGAIRRCELLVACAGSSHPVCRRPRQSRAGAAPGVQVVRTVALHLDARNHARSTVCGSTADGMGAGVSGELRSETERPASVTTWMNLGSRSKDQPPKSLPRPMPSGSETWLTGFALRAPTSPLRVVATADPDRRALYSAHRDQLQPRSNSCLKLIHTNEWTGPVQR